MIKRKTTVPAALILTVMLAGCRATVTTLASGPAASGPALASAEAAIPGGSAASPGAARQPRPGVGPTRPAASKAKAAAAKAQAAAARKTTSAAAGGPSAATWPAVPPTAGSSGVAPVTETGPATPPVTATPPHDDQTTPPPATATPAPEAPSCTVSDWKPQVQSIVSGFVAGTATYYFYVTEYDKTGAALASVVISVPGPFTEGAVVTGTGTASVAMASCQVTSIGESGN